MNRRVSMFGPIALGLALFLLVMLASTRLTDRPSAAYLVGTVIDSSSAVVPNASVGATKIDTGMTRTTITGNTGA